MEIVIINPDRSKELVILQADNVVILLAHDRKGLRRCDRHGENKLFRPAQASGAKRRAGSRTRGDAVIDDNGDTPSDIDPLAVTQIQFASSLNLGKLVVADRLEFGVTDACQFDDVFIADDKWRSTVDHRAHGQFRLHRYTDLAHQDQIKWGVEGRRDFGRHGNAAARQCEDHSILIPIIGKRSSKFTSRIRSIPENHGTLSGYPRLFASHRAGRSSQKVRKPPPGMGDDHLQRSRLGEEVACTRNDLQCLWTFQLPERPLVELDDAMVCPAYDQESRRANLSKHIARKIRTPPTRDDGADPTTKPCGSNKRSRGACACAK